MLVVVVFLFAKTKKPPKNTSLTSSSPLFWQTLAIIPHPRVRLLLPYVGHHVPRSVTPLDRAEAIRPEGEIHARVMKRY